MYNEVKKQHAHFGILYTGKPRHLSTEEKQFYITAFKEEADEYFQAQHLEGEYDALLDLLVFTIGAMLRQGFSPAGINEVVRANMEKQLGPLKNKRRSFELDLIKPEGWTAPDLSSFLS